MLNGDWMFASVENRRQTILLIYLGFKYKILHDEDQHTLVVVGVEEADAGKYHCEAKNELGVLKSTATLEVDSKNQVDFEIYSIYVIFHDLTFVGLHCSDSVFRPWAVFHIPIIYHSISTGDPINHSSASMCKVIAIQAMVCGYRPGALTVPSGLRLFPFKENLRPRVFNCMLPILILVKSQIPAKFMALCRRFNTLLLLHQTKTGCQLSTSPILLSLKLSSQFRIL